MAYSRSSKSTLKRLVILFVVFILLFCLSSLFRRYWSREGGFSLQDTLDGRFGVGKLDWGETGSWLALAFIILITLLAFSQILWRVFKKIRRGMIAIRLKKADISVMGFFAGLECSFRGGRNSPALYRMYLYKKLPSGGIVVPELKAPSKEKPQRDSGEGIFSFGEKTMSHYLDRFDYHLDKEAKPVLRTEPFSLDNYYISDPVPLYQLEKYQYWDLVKVYLDPNPSGDYWVEVEQF